MIIKKNKHFSAFLPCLTSKDSMTRKVTFTESCRYYLWNENQLDYNKLFGFTCSLFDSPHSNSIRFGWRYNCLSKKIEVVEYWYKNKKRHIPENPIPLNIGTEYIFSIQTTDEGMPLLQVSKESTILMKKVIELNLSKGPKWVLGLYFGGNEKSPHEIEILIN